MQGAPLRVAAGFADVGVGGLGLGLEGEVEGPALGGVGDGHCDGVGCGDVAQVAGGLASDLGLLGLRGQAKDGYFRGSPPGLEMAGFGGAGYGYGGGQGLAGVGHAEEDAALVGEGVAVVLIEGAAAVGTWVDLQLQGAGGSFAGALCQGLHGNNCAGADEKGKFVEGGVA